MEGFTESWKKEQLSDLKAQQRKTQQAQRQAQADAAKRDRENMPAAQLQRERQAQEQQMGALALQQWNAGGKQESPEFVQKTIRDAVAALPENNGDYAAALASAVAAGYAKAMQAQAKDMARLQVISESYYSGGGF